MDKDKKTLAIQEPLLSYPRQELVAIWSGQYSL